MKTVFHTSCALAVYNPTNMEKLYEFLHAKDDTLEKYTRCCRYAPDEELMIINNCPGCDWFFSKKYDNVETVTLWEVLAESDFPFPDYKGRKMSLHDPCDVRGKHQVYDAVRKILTRMNIEIEETAMCRDRSKCCGASMYDKMTEEQWTKFAERRAKEFTQDEVAVYCVSCMRYLRKVGKSSQHVIDLLFGHDSTPTPEDKWSELIDRRIEESLKTH